MKGWAPTFFGYSAQVSAFHSRDYNIFAHFILSMTIRHNVINILSPFSSSFKGLFKFGFYEVFKVYYAELLGEENAYVYRTGLFLAASASAEFFADIALAPFEAAKVKIQTSENFASTMRAAMPKMYADEGISAFYKGLVPLWMRQIPYTMMKFACFEKTVELLYA